MKYSLSLLFFLIYLNNGFTQVSGKLRDTAGHSVSFATVSLLKSADSTTIKTTLTDEKGNFSLRITDSGTYLIKVNMPGYHAFASQAFALNADKIKDLGIIVLNDSIKQLTEVVIRASKPLVEQKPGGLTVNVQNSILTKGSSVLEVLSRSPGVIVNPSDNSITLNGKSGVLIMLDGKLMRMSAAQITSLLNGMSADDIDQIELLNTPPAKYDADGNAGLINIITKKNKKRGTSGSVTATGGYGKGEKASASVSVNHNTGKINLQGSYSYSHDHGSGALFANGTETVDIIGGATAFDYNSYGKPLSNYHNFNAGIDYRLSERTSIGANIKYGFGYFDNYANNFGTYALRPDSILLFNAILTTHNVSKNLINSIYIEHAFSKKQKLRIDADYILYKSDGPADVQSTFTDNHGNTAGAGDSLYANRQRDLSNTLIQVGVAKADYDLQLNTKWKLEAGVKGTYTATMALSGIQNFVNGQWVISSVGATSNLSTAELIEAAYATMNVQIDTMTGLIFGGRYEYSHNTTGANTNPLYAIDRKLGKFFPSIIFSRKMNDYTEWQLSYTNRITRPSYSDLASYIAYNDPVSVFTGNPSLLPTVTHNFKIGYSIHNYLFSFLYSRDVDPILGTQITSGPTKGLVYLKPVNADWRNTFNLQVTIPARVNKWFDMNYNFIGGPKEYSISYTPLPFKKTYFSCSFSFTETIKLPKAFSVEVSGNYNLATYDGNFMNYGNTILNAGFKKQLSNNKGSFQLSVADFLRGANYSSRAGLLTTDAFNTNVVVHYEAESSRFPIIKLTYYRSFGAAKTQRHTESSSKEEQGRIGG